MAKKNKNSKNIDDFDKPNGKVAAIIILIIMISSIAGFAVLMGGPTSNSGKNTNTIYSGSNSEIPMGEIFINKQTGQKILGTIRNGEEFQFPDIAGYEQDIKLKNLANKIKSKKNIQIYIDSKFNSPSSVYLIKKALKGIRKVYYETKDNSCSNNKLILTYNDSNNKNNNYKGCMVFNPNQNEEFRKANILVYDLVK